jgi:long-chain fatty acid transport protein
MINIAAPAIVQHHISVGVGIRATSQFEITAAYYHAFRNSGTGSFLTLDPASGETVPVPGTSVTNSMQENSVLLQFSYVSKGAI